MAKQLISSKELNEKMRQADAKIDEIQSDMEAMKADIAKKMVVIRNEQMYGQKVAEELKEYLDGGYHNPLGSGAKILFGDDYNQYGEYDVYGNTIHGKFIRTPRNVFNIFSSSGPLFRSNALAFVNGQESSEFKTALMAEGAPGKGVYFDEYEGQFLKLYVEMDRSRILGDTHFNVIEINPFLEGSFDITRLRVWEAGQEQEPSVELENISRVGKSRIVLDKKYEMLAIEMEIYLHHKNNLNKYPFGLQSLQFLNADFKDESYVIAQVDKIDYIESIGHNILLKSPTETTSSTMTKEGMFVYVDFNEGVLSGGVGISTDDFIYPIARNTNSLFIYIPLKRALCSMVIEDIKTREG